MSAEGSSAHHSGLDERRLALADGLVAQGAAQGLYTAATVAIGRFGKVVHVRAFGTLTPGGSPTLDDSIFDLASLTKPHTAAGLLTQVEDGLVTLQQQVRDILPEAAGAPVGTVTLKQLATHTSGLPPWKPLFRAAVTGTPPQPIRDARKRMVAEILRTPLLHPPGTHYAYSDLGYILIGEIVSRIAGVPLDQYLHGRIFAPMGMHNTGYTPAPTLRSRIAATAHSGLQGNSITVGTVHDENAFALGGVSGHAGLFGTAADVAKFGSALACIGEENGYRLFGIPTLGAVRTNQIDPSVGGHSIGWFVPPSDMLPAGDLFSTGLFGHTGFTGTMIVCSYTLQLVMVMLTNRVIIAGDGMEVIRLRRRYLNAVASAVVG